ncbi:hypothetical protein F9C07_2236451 [Aspergillus flavus]|uniref:Short-chain dehydrogenase n=1 Tax=Aspergillus flavus (strain ATCC 200026 / FGSC A1120 / IAM 13836 / NRRL 3357 / JCM 12722 / SRRC 167) TaxID=332952 RepID=A0A7U2MYJ5_ASPFN|nr:hypothetical protein F9C07_2236451 [Aspergillus flavus]
MRTNYCISVASIRQELKNDSGPLFSWLSNVNQTTDNSNIDPKTWLIVGASRGIGFIFVRLLLASGHRVVATARGPGSALDAVARDAPDRAIILTCDVSRKQSIASFIDQFVQSGVKKVHYAVINAGILGYPNRAWICTYTSRTNHAERLLTFPTDQDLRPFCTAPPN